MTDNKKDFPLFSDLETKGREHVLFCSRPEEGQKSIIVILIPRLDLQSEAPAC